MEGNGGSEGGQRKRWNLRQRRRTDKEKKDHHREEEMEVEEGLEFRKKEE